jgi:hypothetical protein
MAPPGTKAVICENTTRQQSWAPRGIAAWYLGPSKDHYRLYRFYCPEPQAIQVNGSAKCFPQHCKLPTLSPTQHTETVADELFEALATLQKHKRKPILQRIARQLEAVVTNHPPLMQRNRGWSSQRPPTHQPSQRPPAILQQPRGPINERHVTISPGAPPLLRTNMLPQFDDHPVPTSTAHDQPPRLIPSMAAMCPISFPKRQYIT